MKSRIPLGLVIATVSCFALSFVFAKIGGATVGLMPFPASLGSKYMDKRPKIPEVETNRVVALKPSVKTLEVVATYESVTFESSEGKNLEVMVKAAADKKLEVTEENGTVKLMLRDEKEKSGFNFVFDDISPKAYMVVKVPKSISNLDVKLVSGNMRAEKFTLESLKVANVSGDVKFVDANIKETEITSVSGWVGFDGTFDHLKGKLVSGTFNIRTKNPSPKIELASVSGNVKLGLPEKADVTVDTDAVSGDLKVTYPGEKKILGERSALFGKGKGTIRVKTTSGNVTIE